jgi:hypothetical protein
MNLYKRLIIGEIFVDVSIYDENGNVESIIDSKSV